MDVSQLEPAERDPKKLRNTALIITLLMVGGGFLILWAYGEYGKKVEDSTRPSFLHAVTDPDIEMMTAEGTVRNFDEMEGNVVLILALTTEVAPESQPTLDAVRKVMEHFKEADNRPRILCFVLDGDESDTAAMKPVLAEFGAEPEVWRIAAAKDGKQTMRAFLKSKLRFGIYPHEKEGKMIYDTQLMVLNQHRQVRGPSGVPIGWDFEKVAKWEKLYEEAKAQSPEKELVPPKISTNELQAKLIEAIEYLYDHPDEKGQK